jgi:hypothetical protein
MKLTDAFDNVHKKDIKNKSGQVVAQVDYVGWSQVADRLDAASPGWSFNVVQLGDDWCLGRLTLGDNRVFENVGYAENADADWKKEALKDAVSDALKRCAALAGVARYLYDKDTRPSPVQAPRTAPAPVPAAAAGDMRHNSGGSVPGEPPFPGFDAVPAATQVFAGLIDEERCPDHHANWKLVPAGVSKTTGKSYDAFYACPERGCKSRPSKAFLAAQELIPA